MEEDNLPFVSIIMPIRNEAGFIERAIQSILNNNYPPDKMEVIVVDGRSNNGTRAIVQKMANQDSRLRLLDNPGKVQAVAMNIGIRACRGDVFIRIDGHAEIPPDFIKKAVRCLAEHPDAWVVGGYIKTIGLNYIGRAIAAAMSSPIGAGNARFRLGHFEGYVDTLAFGTHHKWVVDKIGYFDEEMTPNEDDEFNLRVLLAGGKIWLEKAIWSKYFARGALKKLWRQYFRYGFVRIRTWQKHRRAAAIRHGIPLIFVLSVMVGALGGFLWHGFWWLLAVEFIFYALVLGYGFFDVARKAGVKYAAVAPMVFAILHFGYGLGSLWGIVRFVILRGRMLKKPEEAKLSR